MFIERTERWWPTTICLAKMCAADEINSRFRIGCWGKVESVGYHSSFQKKKPLFSFFLFFPFIYSIKKHILGTIQRTMATKRKGKTVPCEGNPFSAPRQPENQYSTAILSK